MELRTNIEECIDGWMEGQTDTKNAIIDTYVIEFTKTVRGEPLNKCAPN